MNNLIPDIYSGIANEFMYSEKYDSEKNLHKILFPSISVKEHCIFCGLCIVCGCVCVFKCPLGVKNMYNGQSFVSLMYSLPAILSDMRLKMIVVVLD